jgi:hypothetical protein
MRKSQCDKSLSKLEFIVKYFKYECGTLFRLFRGVEWREVTNKPGSKGYVHLLIATGGAREKGLSHEVVKAHQVVWILHNGEIPEGLVLDHIDGNRTNNAIENLRLASIRGNAQNQKVHRNGRLLGAQLDAPRGCWKSSIKINGKLKFLGRFTTEQEAHEAYLAALKDLK